MSEVNADETERLIRDKIVSLIRDDSEKGRITPGRRLAESTESGADLSGFLGMISGEQDYSDIADIGGNADVYYYSTALISESYAKLSVMLEEKDLLNIVVSVIRNDSRLYPRTTAVEIFKEEPYFIAQEDLNDLLEIIESDERFSDIAGCRTSVDTIYLYSTEYMQKAQAEYLSEWDAVGQYDNQ